MKAVVRRRGALKRFLAERDEPGRGISHLKNV